MRIPPPVVRTLIRRGFLFWLGLEAAAILAGGLGSRLQGPEGQFTLNFHAVHAIPLLVATALVAWIDLVRRDELLFFGNLGLGSRSLIAWCLVPPLVLEFLLTALL